MNGKILSVIALIGAGAIAGVFLVPQPREAVRPAQSCADFVARHGGLVIRRRNSTRRG
jgi:hypothetical protein